MMLLIKPLFQWTENRSEGWNLEDQQLVENGDGDTISDALLESLESQE